MPAHGARRRSRALRMACRRGAWDVPPRRRRSPIAAAGPGAARRLPGRRAQPAPPARRRLPRLHRPGRRRRSRPRLANARAYEEERRRAEALAELDRAKTTFFSNVSHEFRTPLTLMLGPLEDAPGRQERADRAATGSCSSSSTATGCGCCKLVNTLLDFSRIEAGPGRRPATSRPTSPRSPRTWPASFRSAMRAGRAALDVDCPPLPEPVYVDRDMWEKIVLNLLSNAFKFTLRRRRSRVRLRRRGRRRGARRCATPAPASPRRSCRGCSSASTGSRARAAAPTRARGIGLALVQELVRLHGGTIAVDERGWGRARTFTVRLPVGAAHLPADRIVPSASAASSAAARRRPSSRRRCAGCPATRRDVADGEPRVDAGAADGGRPRRILLADDNADMREYVGRLLGAALRRRGGGRRRGGAGAAAPAHPPDLVLTDVMMPRPGRLRPAARRCAPTRQLRDLR